MRILDNLDNIMYYALFLIAAIIPIVYLIDYMTNRNQRLSHLSSNAMCYKLNNDKTFTYIGVTTWVLLWLSIIAVLSYDPTISFPYKACLLVMCISLLIIPTPLMIIKKRTEYVCITDLGISSASTVGHFAISNGACGGVKLQEIWYLIRWNQLQSIEVQRSDATTSGIKKVVIRRVSWDKADRTRITIPGSHPDIQHIILNLREFAPDKFI